MSTEPGSSSTEPYLDGMPLRGRSVLVTGATGFIGGRLARRLARAEGATVTGTGRSLGMARELEAEGIEFVPADLRDAGRIEALLRGRDTVFHAGASLGTDLEEARAVNVAATRLLVRAAGEAGVRRLVHVSSVAVYGDPDRRSVDESVPLATDAPAAYPRTKALGELAAREAAEESGLELVIVRPACVFGPRSAIWTVAVWRSMRAGAPILVGGGTGPFSGIFVDDLVDLLLLSAVLDSAVGEAFNASDEAVPWSEYAGEYARLLGGEPRPVEPEVVAAFLEGGDIPGVETLPDPAYPHILYVGLVTLDGMVFPAERAREMLGWAPRVGIHEGVARTAAWLRQEGLA
jgi:nucleoside-diphosphate-sugar epimerase